LLPDQWPAKLEELIDAGVGPRTNGTWRWEVGQERGRRMKIWASIRAPDALLLCNFAEGFGKPERESQDSAPRVTAWSNDYIRSKMTRGEYWMVRQVRHSNADRAAAALVDLAPDVEVLALVPGSGKGDCELVTLSTHMTSSPLRTLEAKGLLPPARQMGQGAWITRLKLSLDQKDADAMFGVTYLLGFGTFL
jgi:hypothetical protein